MRIIPESPQERDLLWRRLPALRYQLGDTVNIVICDQDGAPSTTMGMPAAYRLKTIRQALRDGAFSSSASVRDHSPHGPGTAY